MATPETGPGDEPVTPAGRMFLRPEMDQVIHCAIGVRAPPDAAAIRAVLADSVMIAHPRFRSLFVRDRRGLERWRRTEVDLDRHIFIVGDESGHAAGEQAVNDYVSDLSVSSPLPTDKPLWELHILMAHRCLVLRVHHALGDGISLMSLFLASCRRAGDPDLPVQIGPAGERTHPDSGRGSLGMKVWTLMRVFWFTLIYVLEFIGRSLWVSDRKTALSGGAGVELWPRKLATATFRLDDLKAVKKVFPNVTVNDVLFGVISSGLSRYLDSRSSVGLREGLQLTGVAMVNLRKQPGLQDLSDLLKNKSGSKWGNKFGIFLLPVYYQKNADPLHHLKRAKAMIDKKKLSLEAQFSYKIADLAMSCLGPKVASLLNYRIVCNTTFTFSNVIGPQEEMTIAGNPVTYLKVSSCALPHAITMHLLSYAGKAYLQILVAEDIIPDPQFLAKCFEEALQELKESAAATAQL